MDRKNYTFEVGAKEEIKEEEFISDGGEYIFVARLKYRNNDSHVDDFYETEDGDVGGGFVLIEISDSTVNVYKPYDD